MDEESFSSMFETVEPRLRRTTVAHLRYQSSNPHGFATRIEPWPRMPHQVGNGPSPGREA
jgi:hypothetical protein